VTLTRGTPCIRSYPPYWRPFLHPQLEEAPCRGDRDPLITGLYVRAEMPKLLWCFNISLVHGFLCSRNVFMCIRRRDKDPRKLKRQEEKIKMKEGGESCILKITTKFWSHNPVVNQICVYVQTNITNNNTACSLRSLQRFGRFLLHSLHKRESISGRCLYFTSSGS
jgi:hypothetical protein